MAWYDVANDFLNPEVIGGGLFGGPLGAGAGYFQHQASKKKKEGAMQARMELEKLAQEQRAQRSADLDRAMGFFGPVRAQMTKLYGPVR